jgi:hypothetical protein
LVVESELNTPDFSSLFARNQFWSLNHVELLERLAAERLTAFLELPEVQDECFTAMSLLECDDNVLATVSCLQDLESIVS